MQLTPCNIILYKLCPNTVVVAQFCILLGWKRVRNHIHKLRSWIVQLPAVQCPMATRLQPTTRWQDRPWVFRVLVIGWLCEQVAFIVLCAPGFAEFIHIWRELLLNGQAKVLLQFLPSNAWLKMSGSKIKWSQAHSSMQCAVGYTVISQKSHTATHPQVVLRLKRLFWLQSGSVYAV